MDLNPQQEQALVVCQDLYNCKKTEFEHILELCEGYECLVKEYYFRRKLFYHGFYCARNWKEIEFLMNHSLNVTHKASGIKGTIKMDYGFMMLKQGAFFAVQWKEFSKTHAPYFWTAFHQIQTYK